MTTEQLEQRVNDSEPVRQLEQRIQNDRTLRVKGMAGSLLSLAALTLARRIGGIHLLVAGDRDEASYLCNDLTNLAGSGAAGTIFFYPTAYKRSVQTLREDPAGIVQRTAVLTALGNHSIPERPLLICTWPDALAEKVADRQRLADHTLRIRRGQHISMDALEQANTRDGAASSTSSHSATTSPTASTFSATTSTPSACSAWGASSRPRTATKWRSSPT